MVIGSVERKVVGGFGAALAALAVVCVTSYRSTDRLVGNAAWVAHTHEAMAACEGLLSDLHDWHVAARGYVITGDQRFLHAEADMPGRIERRFEQVRRLTADTPGQRSRLDDLAPVLEAKLKRTGSLIDVRRVQGFEAARDMIVTGTGERQMDEVRRRVLEIEGVEDQLLSERRLDTDASAGATFRAIGLGSLLATALVGVAAAVILGDVRRRRLAEAELRDTRTLLAGVLDGSPAAVSAFKAVRGAAGRIVDFQWQLLNPAAHRALGLGSLVGKRMLEELPGNVSEGLFYRYAAVVQTGTPADFEHKFVGPGGSAWFQTSAVRLGDGLVVTSVDVTRRKESEDRTFESERRFRSAFDHGAVGMALVTPEGRWVQANRALSNILGYTEAQLRGKTCADVTHPDDRAASEGPRRRLLAGQIETYRTETRYLHGGGRTVWAWTDVSLTRDAAGKPVHLVVQVTDVSERKAVEAALLETTGLQRAILDAANYTIVATDPAGLVTTFNAGAGRLLGYAAGEVVGRAALGLFHDPDEVAARAGQLADELGAAVAPGFEALVARTRLGLVDEHEWTYVRKDGGRVPVRLSVTALRAPSGAVTGFLAVGTDLTEKRKAAEQQARLTAILEATSDFVGTCDLEGNILYNNRALRRLRGFADTHDVRREKVHSYSPPWAADELRDRAFPAAMKEGVWSGESVFLAADGREVPVSQVVIAHRAPDGTPEFLSTVARDITEAQRAKAAAEAASRAKSAFLANMSHEIRTPIAAVVGYADLMLEPGQGEAERNECLQVIRRNSRHLMELINDVLDLSKIEADRVEIQVRDCPVAPLLEEVASMMRPRAEGRGVEFRVGLAGPVPAVIRTDRLRLRQVLVNLLGNAIKFTEEGRVTLTAAFEPAAGGGGGTMRFDVRDTGIGMTEQQAARLFRPFTQADESTTRKFGGTGLGLTISRRLARMLGGDISFRTAPAAGSTFTATVCAGPDAAAAPVIDSLNFTPEPPPPADAGRGIRLHCRVLLAEDGKDNQRLISTYLTKAGADVTVAENGREAVQATLVQPFDVILMDMQMPELDGYGAASEMRRRGLPTPIVALTAHAMTGDREKCLSAGCTDYLTKPVGRTLLLSTLARLMGRTITDTAATPGPAAPDLAPPDPAPPAGPIHTAAPAPPAAGTVVSTMADDPDLAPALAEFVADLPGQVDVIVRSLRESDAESLRRAVHQMKGAGGGYGFDAITALAGAAEASIRASEPVEAVAAKVEELVGLVRRVAGYQETNGKA